METGTPAGQGNADPGPDAALSEDERILHLLLRLTPGATAELVAEVRSVGIEPWLERQLAGAGADASEATPALASRLARLARLELLKHTNAELIAATIGDGRNGLAANELREWVLMRAVYGDEHVREVSCDFFRNHFAVSLDKNEVRFLALAYERDVVLAHSLGNFHDMLGASARHPAMLIFLDNHLSRRAATKSELRRSERDARKETGSEERAREARDIALQRGLNENYARELLELHTLGVDQHYTQNDVIAVAKALTGWTIDRSTWEFIFRIEMHDRDRKQFLGMALKPKQDESEGEFVLDLLERHPGTARFLAYKLCRWLVHDDPDEKMVRRVADVFQRTRGDLPKVLSAIVLDRDFFARKNYLSKFKRPFEFVVSALRVTGAVLENGAGCHNALDAMSESLYRCPEPTGYYDQAESWRDPGALAFRWAFAVDLVFGRLRGARMGEAFYAGLEPDRPDQWREELVRRILPVAGIGPATSAALDRLVQRSGGGRRGDLRAQITALLLGSPEFQRQ